MAYVAWRGVERVFVERLVYTQDQYLQAAATCLYQLAPHCSIYGCALAKLDDLGRQMLELRLSCGVDGVMQLARRLRVVGIR